MTVEPPWRVSVKLAAFRVAGSMASLKVARTTDSTRTSVAPGIGSVPVRKGGVRSAASVVKDQTTSASRPLPAGSAAAEPSRAS